MKKITLDKNTILALLLIAVGLMLLTYPYVSNVLFRENSTSEIKVYEKNQESAGNEKKEEILKKAQTYNELLCESNVTLVEPFSSETVNTVADECSRILCIDNSGIISYVEIPKIDVSVPVFYGTTDEVLEKGAGLIEGTSLPVGGENTHAVIAAHTGLRKAKLFTDLELLKEKDHFYMNTLGKSFAYEIDQIKIVEPENVDDLHIVDGKEYVTLVTCTPYGVNSHRLLVRGHRIPYKGILDDGEPGTSSWMKNYIKSIILGLLVTIAIFFGKIFILRRDAYEAKV